MPPSYATPVTVWCDHCQNQWQMTWKEYIFDFIERKCPKCGYIDTHNCMIPPELQPKSGEVEKNKNGEVNKRYGIHLRYINY